MYVCGSLGVESIFVCATIGHEKLLVNGIYLPPGQPALLYSNYCSDLDEAVSLYDYSHLLIAGDFNLPDHDWINDCVSSPSPSVRHILGAAKSFSLNQINTFQNMRGVILDLIFSSSSAATTAHSDFPLLVEDRHHPALDISLPLELNYVSRKHLYIPNFRKCNLDKVLTELQSLDLIGMCGEHAGDVNQCFNNLSCTIKRCVTKFTPLKRVSNSSFPPWFSKELIKLTIQKKILHTRYKGTLDVSTYNLFSRTRSQCKGLSRQCYEAYIAHVQEVLPNNPKMFWSFIRSWRKDRDSPSTLKLGDKVAATPSDMCDLFADFFSSVFQVPTLPANPVNDESAEYISACNFTLRDVENTLKSLDPFKGCGPDLIPPSVLKHCAPALARPLLNIFNRCIYSGIFPDILKLSYVVPIHKSGSTGDAGNYRPIAIQPALAKVFEKLVLTNIGPSLRRIVSSRQHGFMPNRSTVTNLAVFQNEVLASFRGHSQTDAIYLDFSKAFDLVSHPHLICKLHSYGIHGHLLDWFGSYLRNRELCVKFAGSYSYKFVATSGVPQGSHLGPILFNIFVNDIVEVVKVKHLLFADDIKLFNTIGSEDDCRLLQEGLRGVEGWCRINCMKLNLEKCVVMSFTRSRSTLQFDYVLQDRVLDRCCKIKDLGVTFTSSLNPASHVERVCSRASRNLGMIVRFSRSLGCPRALRSLYCAYVRPHLEYCAVIWSPHQRYLIDELESIQTRFIRLVGLRIGYYYQETPTVQLAARLGLHPLACRRFVQDVLLLHRILNGTIDCSDLLALMNLRVSTGTRSRDLFGHMYFSSNYEMYSTINRIQRQGNLLPEDLDLFHHSLAQTKRRLTLALTYLP